MVNCANGTRLLERNFPFGSFTYHLHKPRTNRFSGVNGKHPGSLSISYPESSGSLVSGLVARRDSGEMEFFPLKSGVPVIVRMLSFIKTEVNVSREVGKIDESLGGNQKS